MGKGELRDKIQRALEIPVELLKDYPRVTTLGNESVFIENYGAIIEYEKNVVRISNDVSVYGTELNVEAITADDILIVGKIKSIEFER